MAIETLDDIIEGLADRIGVYGACGDDCTHNKPCRCCWTSDLRDHLVAAFEIEKKLYPVPAPVATESGENARGQEGK